MSNLAPTTISCMSPAPRHLAHPIRRIPRAILSALLALFLFASALIASPSASLAASPDTADITVPAPADTAHASLAMSSMPIPSALTSIADSNIMPAASSGASEPYSFRDLTPFDDENVKENKSNVTDGSNLRVTLFLFFVAIMAISLGIVAAVVLPIVHADKKKERAAMYPYPLMPNANIPYPPASFPTPAPPYPAYPQPAQYPAAQQYPASAPSPAMTPAPRKPAPAPKVHIQKKDKQQ